MIAMNQYKVARLTPDERPYIEQVQHLLDGHARDGWELVTAFQYEGMKEQAVDQMTQSLSHLSNSLFIFKRTA